MIRTGEGVCFGENTSRNATTLFARQQSGELQIGFGVDERLNS